MWQVDPHTPNPENKVQTLDYGTAAAVEVVEKESGSAGRKKIMYCRCYAFARGVRHSPVLN